MFSTYVSHCEEDNINIKGEGVDIHKQHILMFLDVSGASYVVVEIKLVQFILLIKQPVRLWQLVIGKRSWMVHLTHSSCQMI